MPSRSRTIRVSRSTHELLRALAAGSGATITAVVEEAVRDLQSKTFWAEFNAACEALKANPAAWAELRREDEAWDATLGDGLGAGDDDEPESGREGIGGASSADQP